MCGFTGFLDFGRQLDADAMTATVLGMANTLRHRGPDDRGTWVDPSAGIALGFRRLAIVDLTAEGHQPMASATGRYVMAFNGEIYNHRELRQELLAAGVSAFRGHSDTEVMLAAFERWGPARCLDRFVGMFAFALWDRSTRTFLLARDRIGEKPLYYGRSGRSLIFGSELKALRAYPGFGGEINREGLALYMRFGYVPAPYSIYQGIYKIPSGTSVTIKDDGSISDPVPYWSAHDFGQTETSPPLPGSDTDAVDQLEARLREAVGQQMVADVPLGAFLSGGIDSSTIVALMQAQSTRPVKTFTIGFDEAGFDEARHAKAVARHLGTEHTELYVTTDTAREVIPSLPEIYDEPFADASAIPTCLVSRLAREHVTVSLSGDGGDELFGGYTWYSRTANVWGKVRRVPRVLRRTSAGVLAGLVGDQARERGWRARSNRIGRSPHRDRLRKLATLLGRSAEPEDVHWFLLSKWCGQSGLVLGAPAVPPVVPGWEPHPGHGNVPARLMLTDLLTYLPDDILVKVDRASMGVGLESRAPFLDHRVVEFALRLPASLKFRGPGGKWLLRQVLDRYVPRSLVDRPKMGFSVPVKAWLQGPLHDWADALLEEKRLRREGFLDPTPIRQKWDEHRSGTRNHEDFLWHALMFQAWLAS